VQYGPEQALRCPGDASSVELGFSARPRDLGPIAARNLIRFSPPVEELDFSLTDSRVVVHGQFAAETLYQVSLEPTALLDETGRALQLSGPNRLYLYFPARPSFLRWSVGQGIVERFGPQMMPLEGRGFERVDLRAHPLDPLDRSFWPFPEKPVTVNEDQRPPAPGEEPGSFNSATRNISVSGLVRQLKALGSPSTSALVDLPLRHTGLPARFGLDLKPHLARMRGTDAAGAYLVGIRRLDGSSERAWTRLQATDLSLTTVEEADRVRFVVTSLASAAPVPRARIRVEGSERTRGGHRWVELLTGLTGDQGMLVWRAPGLPAQRRGRQVCRILVEHADDTLVLDPTRAPDRYANRHWESSSETWLQWTQEDLRARIEPPLLLCHLFTERPVYRPDEPVHIKGYIREHQEGELSQVRGSGFLVVQAPGELEWRYPLAISPAGSFYHRFEEADLPTGEYRAHFEYRQKTCGAVRFAKEAYRIPRFEVRLHGPDTVGLDGKFRIQLTSRYYAGGRVAGRPVRWRVTEFPYAWEPKARAGFFYSSDARYSSQGKFRSRPALHFEDTTDDEGGAVLDIDPGVEPEVQPRRYMIEATVVGSDDQTVTDVHAVLAVPPFVLGAKVPRYLERATQIEPEVIVVGPEGQLVAGHRVRVRLLQRQWHSYLRAGDFSQGVAKYVTDVVDEPVFETTVVSNSEPQRLKIPIEDAGVYIVELEARDRQGRTQSVQVDLYAGGAAPITWSQPPSRVFRVSQDRERYIPGQIAHLVLESPFQTARALAVVEEPSRNRYQWVDVRNGAASFALLVEKRFVPRLPVHFVLLRGRVPGVDPRSGAGLDLGRPAAVAATAWVEVEPVKQRLRLELAHPDRAMPGEDIEVRLRLADDEGHPLAGEATLWLVDQAVLALGREQRLDPLPDFLTHPQTRIGVRDTRNLVLGYLPFEEQPGGGEGGKEARSLLDRVTVRKNFVPVPYYEPAIPIGVDGVVTVQVRLPDNLTNFKLRAKAVSGTERFGFATGHLAVRLPVIVQPSLPRFVRSGDRFTAVAIGRVVEGDGGPGVAEVRVDGLELEGTAKRALRWQAGTAQRIQYPVRVPASLEPSAQPDLGTVGLSVAVERSSDRARDAFAVTLPIRADRRSVSERVLGELSSGSPELSLSAVGKPYRRGTLERSVLLSDEPAIVRMVAGLDYLAGYPHGCTEQRISQARVLLATGRLRGLLEASAPEPQTDARVGATLAWIETSVDDRGLVGYWPGTPGYVSLTAWSLQFLGEARAAGYTVSPTLLDRLAHALRQSLRSDYPHFIAGEAYAERCWALSALAASGDLEAGYAAELARRAQFLSLESLAQVVRALRATDGESDAMLGNLKDQLWGGIAFRQYQGRELYAGLQSRVSARNGLILPSETRTLAEILRTVDESSESDRDRTSLLKEALVGLGRDDGWGDTNTNAAAILALAERLSRPDPSAEPVAVELTLGTRDERLVLGGKNRLRQMRTEEAGAMRLALSEPETARPLAVRVETRYLPAADGSQEAAQARGFAVRREWQRVVAEGEPPLRLPLEGPGTELELSVGDVIEEHLEVVSPKDRHYVAVIVPLAAGVEPLNPSLATAPPEARPSGVLTLQPSHVAYLDEQMGYYYDSLPKGAYHFYFRTRASTPGTYIQPAAYAELMYEQATRGNSPGARVRVVAERDSFPSLGTSDDPHSTEMPPEDDSQPQARPAD
jgi:uncharacterized protein YfaS (alpha-2-macroglobulin family)